MSARNYVPAMVKWMVEEGAKNTSSGNWIFTSAEIAEAFPVAESSVIEMFGASMYRSTIENCAIFKNILETQGIRL